MCQHGHYETQIPFIEQTKLFTRRLKKRVYSGIYSDDHHTVFSCQLRNLIYWSKGFTTAPVVFCTNINKVQKKTETDVGPERRRLWEEGSRKRGMWWPDRGPLVVSFWPERESHSTAGSQRRNSPSVSGWRHSQHTRSSQGGDTCLWLWPLSPCSIKNREEEVMKIYNSFTEVWILMLAL